MKHRVVIIGAGQAGFQVAASLAQKSYDGDILLLGAEKTLPYERPPLSKAFLKGDLEEDRLLFRTASFYEEKGIILRTNCPVVSIDKDKHSLTTADGEAISYDTLVIATGARLRHLSVPGADLKNIHYLRALEDSRALHKALVPGKKLAIIGGGYIGLEVAASARHLGVDVMVIEATDRVMARTASPYISEFLSARHRKEAVELKTGTSLAGFEGRNGYISGVRLEDGTICEADLVVAGIGVIPEISLALKAGLATDHGILVDHVGATSVPHIYAAGDCARYSHPHGPGAMTIESVQNAVDQAKAVASAILGTPIPYDAVPWFWSDQYDLKLQTAGLFVPGDEAILRALSQEDHAISVVHLRDGCFVAIETINRMRDFVQAKKLIAAHARPDRHKIANPDIPLKDLL